MFKSTHYPIEIIEFKELDSTNIYCKTLANKTPKTEKVVLAHFQSKGKGQFDKEWESEPDKNLTFSILHYPQNLDPMQYFHLNRAVALGVLAGIINYVHAAMPHRLPQIQDKLSIKWPNDIFLGSFKLGGILIENTIQGHLIDHSIIGIGLNLNQTYFSSKNPFANSLGKLLDWEIDRHELFDLLLEQIFKHLYTPSDQLEENYNKLLYAYKRPALFMTKNQILKGIVQGVDHMGRLIILDITTPQQDIKSYLHKEIFFTHIFFNPSKE